LPDELAHAQSRLQRLKQAKAELEQEAQEQLQAATTNLPLGKRGRPSNAERASRPVKDRQQREKEKKQRRRAKRSAQQPTRQYNFVDPDSRVMKDNGQKAFVQAYNAQIAVDSQAQIIVAAELTQQTTDRQQLLPMVESIRNSADCKPEIVVADAGYWDTTSLLDPALEGIQVLVSPDAKPQPPGAQLPANAPRNEEAVRMRKVLASDKGKARYALRKSTVEPVFGQIKEARGIRRFRLRGLTKVTSEWKFICATHNLLKLFRHRAAALGSHPNDPLHHLHRRGSSFCTLLRPITRLMAMFPGPRWGHLTSRSQLFSAAS